MLVLKSTLVVSTILLGLMARCSTVSAAGTPAPISPDAAVRALIVGYAKCLDGSDEAACARFFIPDGSLFFYKGRDAIAERLSKDAEVGPSFSRVVHGIKVKPTGSNTASAVSEMTVSRKNGANVTASTIYRFNDTLVRIDGRWLFGHREATPVAFQQAYERKKEPAIPDDFRPDDNAEIAIRNLIAIYAECIDTKQPPNCVSELFAEDGSLNQAVGRPAILSSIAHTAKPALPVAQTDMNTVFHQYNADHGMAVTDAMFFHKGDASDMVWTAWDRYFDQFVLVDGNWRFSHREIVAVGR